MKGRKGAGSRTAGPDHRALGRLEAALAADSGLDATARAVARRAGLAEFCEGIRVESQETVDRDFAGNWLHRLR